MMTSMFRLDSLLFLFFEGESLEQFLGFFGCDAILFGGLKSVGKTFDRVCHHAASLVSRFVRRAWPMSSIWIGDAEFPSAATAGGSASSNSPESP